MKHGQKDSAYEDPLICQNNPPQTKGQKKNKVPETLKRKKEKEKENREKRNVREYSIQKPAKTLLLWPQLQRINFFLGKPIKKR